MQLRSLFLSLAALSPAAFGAVTTEPTREQAEFFESKIRPILAENCYKCHSVEKGKAKGDLTLDTRAGTLKGGENGKVIVPGDPEKSPMIVAVNYLDPDLQMPPKGDKITPAQVALLTQWVKMGAPDPRKDDADIHAKLSGLTDAARNHWAYLPVTKPAVPKTNNAAWSRTPVDAFILAKLDENKMVPAPDATKEALLRRATYDLHGLPPTPQEVKAFLDDQTPQAFVRVVDRLLASPHYGERWGRFWLDTARYSDTAGGDNKKLKGEDYRFAYAWTYRDWVVKSFNADLPYDQFIVQQLAADQLPNNPPENLAALGFVTVGERFKNVNDRINDRIDAVSKGFLGLTVSCARCHDHKFDPIPTKDYYALHGIFASTIEPEEKPIIAQGAANKNADYLIKQAEIEARNRTVYYGLVEDLQSDFFRKVDGYLLVARYGGKKGGDAEQVKQRTELLNKASLDRDTLQMIAKNLRGEMAIFGPFRAFVDIDGPNFSTKAPAIVAQIAAGKLGRSTVNPLVAAAFKDATVGSLEDVAAIYKKLFASLDPQRKAFVQANAKAAAGPVTGFEAPHVAIFNALLDVMPASKATTEALRDVVAKLPNKMAQRAPFQFAKLNELELTNAGAPARAMLVADAARPKDSSVFIRGQAEVRGETVPRRFLEILSPNRQPVAFRKESSGRLELAQNIANRNNPLTARVVVNRVWMHHFGEGFVRTLDDLGVQSEKPSHPELLDYLSTYFMDAGWSLKKLHKLVMLSHVYQQSTRTQPQFEVQDPENRLLWRANVRRLDFEAMRDSLLVFSGQLDGKVGGQPINLTDEPYSFRRSVYGYIDRGNLPELMQNFDFSDPDMPNSKRTTTIVPQQALFFMNSPMSVDVTRKIVARPEVTTAPDALGRLFAIYRILFQRPPTQNEVKLAYQFVGAEDNQLIAPMPESAATAAASASGKKGMVAATGKNSQKVARMEEQEKRKAEKKKQGRYGGTAAIQNEGTRVERKPLTPWETYVQALLFSNEAAYVN